MEFKSLAVEVHENAVKHGFWDNPRPIPWGVQLGNPREAVKVLEYFLRQLTGDQDQEEQAIGPQDSDIPF